MKQLTRSCKIDYYIGVSLSLGSMTNSMKLLEEYKNLNLANIESFYYVYESDYPVLVDMAQKDQSNLRYTIQNPLYKVNLLMIIVMYNQSNSKFSQKKS